MTTVPITGGPQWDFGTRTEMDSAKMTAWRSVLDSKRNRIVYVDVDGSLWAPSADADGLAKGRHHGREAPGDHAVRLRRRSGCDRRLVRFAARCRWRRDPRRHPGDLAASRSTRWPGPRPRTSARGRRRPQLTVSYVEYAVVYDPVRQQTILHTLGEQLELRSRHVGLQVSDGYDRADAAAGDDTAPGDHPATRHHATTRRRRRRRRPRRRRRRRPRRRPRPSSHPYGTITSFPLPALREAPYNTLISSKHTNMAYSPTTGRLYVSGGDWLHSATDGTWSMSLADGSWRRTSAHRSIRRYRRRMRFRTAPGFEWVPSRSKFLMWPGSYYPYGCPYIFTDARCLTDDARHELLARHVVVRSGHQQVRAGSHAVREPGRRVRHALRWRLRRGQRPDRRLPRLRCGHPGRQALRHAAPARA